MIGATSYYTSSQSVVGKVERADVQIVSQTDLFQEAVVYLKQGRSVILYTALGPEDSAIQSARDWLTDHKYAETDSGKLLGAQMGKLAGN